VYESRLRARWSVREWRREDLSQRLPCCQMLLGTIEKWRPPTAATCITWLRCPRIPTTATRGNRTRQLFYISTPNILDNTFVPNSFAISSFFASCSRHFLSPHVKWRISKASIFMIWFLTNVLLYLIVLRNIREERFYEFSNYVISNWKTCVKHILHVSKSPNFCVNLIKDKYNRKLEINISIM